MGPLDAMMKYRVMAIIPDKLIQVVDAYTTSERDCFAASSSLVPISDI